MIIAAADGSSLSNPGPAGWAWYVDDDRWGAGGWARGTNNMGELMARNLEKTTPVMLAMKKIIIEDLVQAGEN